MTLSSLPHLAQQLLSAILSGAGIAVLFSLPFAVLAWLLNVRRRKFRAESLEPFTEMPLRPPGESLRLKIEFLSDDFDAHLTVGAIVVVGAAIFAGTHDGKPVAGFLGLFVFGVCGWIGVRLFRLQTQLWRYRLGFTGERVVGEALNRLVARGFHVFHDVPFEEGKNPFNIDHVLVGPPGVYAVETKTRRKPADVRGLPKATVYSDGTTLRFPKYDDTSSIPQARRNAQSLAKWMTSATGEPVAVRAILTIPGWRVERIRGGDVNVLRPDEIQRSFVMPEEPLSSEQIKRISHQLAERCRIVAEKK
jgi:hypothetical protein